jgi:spore coat protein U-like protein
MRAVAIALLTLTVVGVCADRASAATATATLAVSATVSKTCLVSNGTLAFGTYSPVSASPTDNTATFTVACTKNTAATIGLNTGSNASGSIRRLSDGGGTPSYLSYELYQDAARSAVWGNTAGSWVANTSTSNATQTFTVYGRISALQDVPSTATYNDSVTITVTF